jgi:hypothetical protein
MALERFSHSTVCVPQENKDFLARGSAGFADKRELIGQCGSMVVHGLQF